MSYGIPSPRPAPDNGPEAAPASLFDEFPGKVGMRSALPSQPVSPRWPQPSDGSATEELLMAPHLPPIGRGVCHRALARTVLTVLAVSVVVATGLAAVPSAGPAGDPALRGFAAQSQLAPVVPLPAQVAPTPLAAATEPAHAHPPARLQAAPDEDRDLRRTEGAGLGQKEISLEGRDVEIPLEARQAIRMAENLQRNMQGFPFDQ